MASLRRIVIPGGSGYLGRVLAAALTAQGWDVVVLTRHPISLDNGVQVLPWNGATLGRWMAALDGALALRTETELLLKSRRVVPRRLLAAGFDFRFPSIEGALANLMQARS
jgi:NAD dependent epimerase/dehydratase family enzyme